MRQINTWTLVFIFSALSLGFSLQSAEAHGTGYRVVRGPAAITVDFFYSDNEPMSYSEVLVFGPQDKDVEYQNGRTDRQGRFAFCPRATGTWQIEADDGMGHKAQCVVQVAPERGDIPGADNGPEVAEQPGMTSMPLKAALGLSLIANLAFLAWLWKKNMQSRKDATRF